MSEISQLRLHEGDLLKRFGSQRSIDETVTLDDLRVGSTVIPADAEIVIEAQLERIADGVVVRGGISSSWVSECSRCLQAAGGPMFVSVDELFESEAVAGETYPLDGEILDLEPLIRDALVLELPQAPVCRVDCEGLCPECGIDRNVQTCTCAPEHLDPRWAALQSLDLDQ